MTPFSANALKTHIKFRKEEDGSTALVLDVTADGLADRSDVAGWVFPVKKKEMLLRLERCIKANKAYLGYEIKIDINKKTYISATQSQFFHGRHMNASLKKLGF